jgi:chitinase
MFRPALKFVTLLASMLSLVAGCLEPAHGSQEAPASVRPLTIAYLAPWKMPANGLRIAEIPANLLTHLYYAFGKVTDDGLAVLPNPCEDTGECEPNSAHDTPGGNFAQLLALKQSYPNLELMISLGGWSGSKNFSNVAASAEARKRFVASCIERYILKYPDLFDGIDVDWEFPVEGGLPENSYRPGDRENFSLLMAEFRRQLDLTSASTGKPYRLSIAVSAAPNLMRNLDVSRLADTVDWINLMTYDYHAGSDIAHFNAPLFGTKDDPTPQLNLDSSVQAFLDAGVSSYKLVVGVPFYGRAYGQVASKGNGLFQSGEPSPVMNWAEDTVDYRVLTAEHLEASGFTRFWHPEAQVPWLYNPKSKVWITYDDPLSIRLKAAYVREHGLGGIMIWELGADDGNLLKAIQSQK